MTRLTDRRAVLVAVGTAAMAAASGSVTAQSSDISGIVEFENGEAIPKGQISVYLEDPAQQTQARSLSAAEVKSTGGAKTVEFTLAPASSGRSSAPMQVVAQLQRADGWLLARGSVDYQAGTPVRITLYTVMY